MKKTLGHRIIDGLNELTEALERGGDIQRKFNVRNVELNLVSTRYTPGLVKKTRKAINASQVVFARFLGVAPNTVRAWEQGANIPNGLAARFLDEIRRNPEYWKARILESSRARSTSKSRNQRATVRQR